MKHLYILLFILMPLAFEVRAQPSFQKQDRAKQIEALKIGFITRKLDLSPEESQRFWPVYNNYQKDLAEILKEKKLARIDSKDKPNEQLDDELNFDAKLLELRKRYRKEFASVIPAQKVVGLFQAEREFRETLIRELKNRRKP